MVYVVVIVGVLYLSLAIVILSIIGILGFKFTPDGPHKFRRAMRNIFITMSWGVMLLICCFGIAYLLRT